MKDANKKYYFSTASAQEKISFLSGACTDKLSAEVWKKGQDKDQVEEFEIISYDKLTHRLSLKFNGGLLSKLTGSKNRDQDVLLKISYGPIYIFTSTILKLDTAKDEYYAIINQDIYKSQQRTNYRLMANKFVKIQFKISQVVHDALDISAGGTSFLVPASEIEKFKKGAIHEDCIIRLANFNYNIPQAKIAGFWEQEFHDAQGNIVEGYKIGIAFVDLPKKTEEELFLSINTEARGEEIRKKSLEKKG